MAKMIVTLEIEVEDSLVLNLPAAQENLTYYTERAISDRLFGAGFMPDDVEIDSWTVTTIWDL